MPGPADIEPMTLDAVVRAYAAGAFPMAEPSSGQVRFYTADPRAIVPLSGGFHAPRTVERDLRRGRFVVRADTAFAEVVAACAQPRSHDNEPWLDATIASWAVALFHVGHAHCVEAWARGEDGSEHLVGGVYGVSIGRAFFGESMFTRPRPRRADGSRDPIDGTGASSAALVTLTRHLVRCGYTLFDAQIPNDHTRRFGVVTIPLAEYQERLAAATAAPDAWVPLSGHAH